MKVMGIVNVTPDSFSDGGRFYRPEEAARRARNLLADGADVIDLGGESTRPGATPLGWEEEWSRLEPLFALLAGAEAVISVDTYHPETAERALAAGARMINCVYVEPVVEMRRLVRAHPGTELVVPAAAYDPATVTTEYLDPMIGFGTTREEDVARLRSIPDLARLGRVLVGASRKRIVKKLVGEKAPPGKDLAGNLAIVMWAAFKGAGMVRVHDVRESVQALRVLTALDSDLCR